MMVKSKSYQIAFGMAVELNTLTKAHCMINLRERTLLFIVRCLFAIIIAHILENKKDL